MAFCGWKRSPGREQDIHSMFPAKGEMAMRGKKLQLFTKYFPGSSQTASILPAILPIARGFHRDFENKMGITTGIFPAFSQVIHIPAFFGEQLAFRIPRDFVIASGRSMGNDPAAVSTWNPLPNPRLPILQKRCPRDSSGDPSGERLRPYRSSQSEPSRSG